MGRQVMARLFFAATALVVLVGMIVQLAVSAGITGSQFDTVAERIVNVFCYFTVQSNLLVGITTLLLAIRLDRQAALFRAFRLSGLVAIIVTGVIFHVILAGDQQLSGAAAMADTLLHTVVPIMAVLGWLVFGLSGTITWQIVLVSLMFPLWWVTLALVRGPIVDFYAYPFIDVRMLGYPRVFLNLAFVAVMFVALATLVKLVEGVRARRTSTPDDRSATAER